MPMGVYKCGAVKKLGFFRGGFTSMKKLKWQNGEMKCLIWELAVIRCLKVKVSRTEQAHSEGSDYEVPSYIL